MIDIVTVVFEEEITTLQIQAQSIDIFCRDLGIKNIFVIVNDTAEIAKKIQTQWWGEFAHLVQIIPRERFGKTWVENGWVSQQVLKLLGASLSQNTWSMILDAKTLLTNYVEPSVFVAPDGRYKLKLYPILPVFEPAAEIAGRLFNISVTEIFEPAGVPFIFHNDSLRKMIHDVENLAGHDFLSWFQAQGMLTEFVLYSAYLKYLHGNLLEICNQSNSRVLSNNICHSEVEHFDRKLTQAKINQGLTIGVHRRAWPQLTTQQQTDYVEYLISRGLDRARLLL